MDYSELAVELFNKMQSFKNAEPQKNIDEAMRGEAFVLHYIASHGGEAVPGEIGGEMNVTSARIAQTLNGSEKKGYITRRIDQNDRRRIIVSLTLEGKKEEERQHRMIMESSAKMLEMLGEHDAKEHVRIVGKLAEIIAEIQSPLQHMQEF